MEESLFSPSWYRVAKLKPRLRKHAQIHRHYYSGELWYVLQDHTTGRFYRFTPILFHIIGLMDGTFTVQELWEKAMERFGDDAPTQGDMVRMLSQLHAANVMQCDVPPDIEELFHRYVKTESSKWKQSLRSPLSLRFPLIDPERFLSRTISFVRPLFSIFGLIVWLAVVGTALVLAGLHWPELTKNAADRILSAQNLVLMWFVYPVVKVLHEFGHGYAVKRWGGEVHEMGIMFLVLMPIPYVDASSTLAFPEKGRRILVGVAGMMAELFVASIALFFWLNVEHGILRSIAYNIIIIASVSTIMFNANPLLRYDGYYVLSDLLEIPNLAQRSLNYLGYLFKRYLLGLRKIEPPYVGPGERFWLFVYSAASFIYRAFIYAAIIIFISGKFFIIGVLLGIWAAFSIVIIPVFKRIHFVLFSPVLREKRFRACMISGFLLAIAVALIFLMPFPSWTRTEGVIWVPEESLVRAGTNCFVEKVKAVSYTKVKKGDIVIECEDPLLAASAGVLRAQLKALQAQYDAEILTDRVKARITKEEIAHTSAELARSEERLRELTIYSQIDGTLILPEPEDLPGRYLKQGDLVAYVLNEDKPTVRVVVSQSDVDLIRHQNKGVEIRLAERIEQTIPAYIKREVPGAQSRLPSLTLSNLGGGKIAIDPSDKEGLKTLENLFQFDIEPATTINNINIGERVFVRFDHGFEPLSVQWYRSIRRLLLRRFNV